MEAQRTTLMLAGVAGIVATLMVGTGEFMLHFSSTGYVNADPYAFLHEANRARIVAGHFLAVLGGPLYFLGYWRLYQGLKPAKGLMPLGFFLTGAYGFAIGTTWIGSRALIVLLAPAQVGAAGTSALMLDALVADYDFLYENLLQVIRVTTLIASGLFVYLVLRRRTLYPRWVALANPFLVLVAVFVSYFLVPAVGIYLLPTAMNVAHFVFFSAALIGMSQQSSLDRPQD